MNRPRRVRDPRRDAAWLAAALREQADEHQADIARIELRFNRLIAAEPARAARRNPERPARPRLLLIGVPLGVLATVTTVAIAAGVPFGISHQPSRSANQAAATPRPSPTSAGRQSDSPAPPHPAGIASPRSVTTSATPPGPLTATGTIDSHSTLYWAQEDLSVTTTRAIKALKVTVIVSGGDTVRSTGSWSTILAADIDSTVTRTPAGLTYDFILKPGQILQPGTYAFGFQFGRPATGHNFALDKFTVTATTVQDAGHAFIGGAFP